MTNFQFFFLIAILLVITENPKARSWSRMFLVVVFFLASLFGLVNDFHNGTKPQPVVIVGQ